MPKLSKQDILQTADSRLINRTRVICDQAHKSIISAQLAEEPRAIDRVKACIDQTGGVTDVMKPGSRHEDVSSHTGDH